MINEKITGPKCSRNREILKYRFLQGLTFAEIAEKMEMSEIQISRIVHRYGDPLLFMIAK